MKKVALVLVIALAFGFIVPTQAAARGSWTVHKLSLNFKDGTDTIIKKDLTQKEAEEMSERLNKTNEERGYVYQALPANDDDSIVIRPGQIQMPKLGFIDVGRPKTDAKKVPSLAGKTGKGKIGNAAVTFKSLFQKT
jgi:hypothetical protein